MVEVGNGLAKVRCCNHVVPLPVVFLTVAFCFCCQRIRSRRNYTLYSTAGHQGEESRHHPSEVSVGALWTVRQPPVCWCDFQGAFKATLLITTTKKPCLLIR